MRSMRHSNSICMEKVLGLFPKYQEVNKDQAVSIYVGKTYSEANTLIPGFWNCYDHFGAELCLSPYDAAFFYNKCLGQIEN